MSVLLDVRNLRVHYGGIEAVGGIDFEVEAGERVTLIGANGAGKSSTLKAIAGLVMPSEGYITYDGLPLQSLPAWQRVGHGLALVPEGRGVFHRLTVEENLLMGAYHRSASPALLQELDHVYGLFGRLHERRQQQAGTLSGGEQQMLAIGRALMSSPKLLMLDEPSMGLAPLMVEKIFEVICKIADEGVTLLLVEQNARLALELCDRAYVMESGKITLTDTAEACLSDPQVRSAYLGDDGAREITG